MMGLKTGLGKVYTYASTHLNFFRIHLTVFTLLPFIFSAFFYAANGTAGGNARDNAIGIQKVEYIDSLFSCFSAMTVTGLATVNLSALHAFQQVLLFILFLCGDYSIISLVMVLVRKRYFRTHCSQLLNNDHIRRIDTTQLEGERVGGSGVFNRRFTSNPTKTNTRSPTTLQAPKLAPRGSRGSKTISGPTNARVLGNFVTDEEERRSSHRDQVEGGGFKGRGVQESPISMERLQTQSRVSFRPSFELEINTSGNAEGPTAEGSLESDKAVAVGLPSAITIEPPAGGPVRQYQARQRIRSQTRGMSLGPSPKTQTHPGAIHHTTEIPLDQGQFEARVPYSHLPQPRGKHSGMGGFPHPLSLIPYILPKSIRSKVNQRFSKPELSRKLTLLTNPNAVTTDQEKEEDESGWSGLVTSAARWMPDTLASLVVGRNSRFYTEELDDEELEQVGGVEYRALRLLSYAVAAYIFLFQAIPFAILAIYFAKVRSWDGVFESALGVQAGTVNKTWVALFSTVSAYTGTGLTLTDQSMLPFNNCFLLIYVLNIVMLAGNHALPMMLRFYIWLGTKIFRKGQMNETLHFLLDHPRRCFLYLFPSHQTWFLAFLLVVFMITEVAGFFLLQIGLPVIQHDGWMLFSDALFQSLSVRASGFSILPIANFAPALLFLYVILMYVAIYPIAMSIRSTNVYEERSLGVFEHDDTPADEPTLQGDKSEVFSKYLIWHMRRQLAFDIWPLCLAIFLICIFERGKIMNPETSDWFTIFKIIFECTSAYSTIGLSLGTPNNNWSFCGEFGTASKLVMIGVMLRGRHRGLPVAIDRAILLPQEMARIDRKNASDAAEMDAKKQ